MAEWRASIRERVGKWMTPRPETATPEDPPLVEVDAAKPIVPAPATPAPAACGYSGGETLACEDLELSVASVLDLWQRAYSNIRDNTQRGTFAEWMVWRVLGLTDGWPQPTWKNCDIMAGPVRIEVKTSGYIQSFHAVGHEYPDDPARIKFMRLKTRLFLNEEETEIAATATFNCDLYVLTAQLHRVPETWDALDLSQWEFYCLKKRVLKRADQASMNLNTLRMLAGRHNGGPFTAAQFRVRALRLIDEIAERK
jgi:hypothetical protein